MLTKTVLDRVDKVEAELKEVNIDVNALKVSMAIAEEKSRHHRQEVDAKCDKLRLEVKDLLLAMGLRTKKFQMPQLLSLAHKRLLKQPLEARM